MLEGNVASDANQLRKFFNRFKREELYAAAVKVEVDKKFDLDELDTKASMISTIIGAFEKGISFEEIAAFDLFYFQKRVGGKKWQTMKLIDPNTEDNEIEPILDATKLKQTLSKNLTFFLSHHLHVDYHNGALWIRLFVQDSVGPTHQLTSGTNTLFCIYLPRSPYLLVTAMKKAHRDYIAQALVSTFNCRKLEEIELSGKDAQSLTDMLLHQQSQGAFRDYRMGEYDSNPLSRTLLTTTMATTTTMKKNKTDSGPISTSIIVEDAHVDEKRKETSVNVFGKSEAPKLEKVEFHLSTTYKGGPKYKIESDFVCKVKLEGTSVLSGLKELTSTGVAEAPLSSILSELHSSAKTTFQNLTDINFPVES